MNVASGGAGASLNTYFSPGRAVVVIDPDPRFRDLVARALSTSFRVSEFADIDAAVGRTKTPPAAVLVGEAAPAAKGPAPVRRLRQQPAFRQVPIIQCGAQPKTANRDLRPEDLPDAVIDRSVRVGELIDLISRLVTGRVEEGWETLPAGPRDSLRRTLAVFRNVGDLIAAGSPMAFESVTDACAPILGVVKDSGTRSIFEGLRDHDHVWYVHSLRVATLLALFGYTIGLKDEELMLLASAGLVHDFGKTALPKHILNKVGPLDDQEMKVARSHIDVTVGYLRTHSDTPRQVVAITEQHQERLDGSGYPRGLAEAQINDLARMTAIVDVFAALTERRSYRAAMSPFQALEVMQENITAQLDQRLVRLFRDMLLQAA